MRFRLRHLQQTLADHVEAHLASLGWKDDPPPWDIAPITFREVQTSKIELMEPTLVSTSVESEGDRELEQLGGGMWKIVHMVIFDVVAEKPSIALSLTGDIRGSLEDVIIPLFDYTTSSPVEVAGSMIEAIQLETVVGQTGGSTSAVDIKRSWRSVLATIELTISED